MLVTFKSTSYADITMFGEVAEKLLKMMGQSGNVPGAITSDHVPKALLALNTQLAALDSPPADKAVDNIANRTRDHFSNGEDDGDAPISLATRAQPLIQLLEASVAGSTDVLWEN